MQPDLCLRCEGRVANRPWRLPTWANIWELPCTASIPSCLSNRDLSEHSSDRNLALATNHICWICKSTSSKAGQRIDLAKSRLDPAEAWHVLIESWRIFEQPSYSLDHISVNTFEMSLIHKHIDHKTFMTGIEHRRRVDPG